MGGGRGRGRTFDALQRPKAVAPAPPPRACPAVPSCPRQGTAHGAASACKRNARAYSKSTRRRRWQFLKLPRSSSWPRPRGPPAPQPCEVSARAGRARPRGVARPHLLVGQRQVLDSLDVDRLRERHNAKDAPKAVSQRLRRGPRRLWRTHLANFGADLIDGEPHRGDAATSPSGGSTLPSLAHDLVSELWLCLLHVRLRGGAGGAGGAGNVHFSSRVARTTAPAPQTRWAGCLRHPAQGWRARRVCRLHPQKRRCPQRTFLCLHLVVLLCVLREVAKPPLCPPLRPPPPPPLPPPPPPLRRRPGRRPCRPRPRRRCLLFYALLCIVVLVVVHSVGLAFAPSAAL